MFAQQQAASAAVAAEVPVVLEGDVAMHVDEDNVRNKRRLEESADGERHKKAKTGG
jgi:hypothetical protein